MSKVTNLFEYKLAKKCAEEVPQILKAIEAFRTQSVKYYKYDEVSSILGTMWDVETYLQIKLYKADKILNSTKESRK